MRDPVIINEKKSNTKPFLLGGLVGFIVGCVLTFGFLVILGTVMKVSNVDTLTNTSSEVPVTYFEVDFNGEVHRLHTGMPKDSVIQILGRPKRNSMMEIGGQVREDMTFYSDDDYTSRISLEFEDGKLKEYSVY